MRANHTRAAILAGALTLLTALAPAGAASAAPVQADGGILFSYSAPDAGAVFLAGDFNGWDASGLPMAKDADGVWSVVVELAEGAWEYKFVVDGDWREDPDNPRKKTDPFGGSNSVVVVGPDGTLDGPPAAAAVTTATGAAGGGDITVGRPVGTDAGILFTFRSRDAGSVNLAGSFNGWSATEWPLQNDGDGNWSIVKPLDAGAHQYKFVVDGNWLTDPENPETQDDGYGGSNSQVTVDAGGMVVAGAVDAGDGGQDETRKASNLNAKLFLSGRYLTRFEMAKNVTVGEGDNVATDPRFRMQRPTQSVDLNFEAEVSEQASTYMRMRLDSNQNIIQNNIAGFLDEANLQVDPKNFYLKAYWNQEVYTGSDLLQSGGNIDLPGTIMHDHLDYGKGSGGAYFEADPWGFNFDAFFANVHNQDYYNDPDLFDNTGEDKIGLRLARRFGGLEIGVPVWVERSLVELDLSSQVSTPPTGIPALDDYLGTVSGQPSDKYDTESHVYNVGTDVRYHVSESFMAGAQFMYVDYLQRFVTGDRAWQGTSKGRLDIPFLERDRRLVMGQVDWKPNDGMNVSVKQIVADMKGVDADQRYINYTFVNQGTANKRIYFEIQDSPAQAKLDSTDVTFDWSGDDKNLKLWLRRARHDLDFGAAGRTVPEDSTMSSREESNWYAAARMGLGRTGARWGRGEVEIAYSTTDLGAADRQANSLEVIFRYDRDLTRNVGLIADLRYIKYDVEGRDEAGASLARSPDYFAPFAGFRYTPIDNLELVLAYGVDPVEYSIDYEGRHLGRWWRRQNYLFDNPEADLFDAEDALSKAKVFTLRAQLLF